MASPIIFLTIWFVISIPVTFFIGAILGLGKNPIDPQNTIIVRDNNLMLGELS